MPTLTLAGSGTVTQAAVDYFSALGRWADWMEATGYAAKTQAGYLACLSRAGAIRRKDPRYFTEDDVMAVVASFAGKGPAKGRMVRSLRCFFTWAEDGELLVNPARRLKVPREKYPPAPALSPEHLTRVLIAATFVDPRAPWALLLAYATGGRAASLCAVTPEDVRGDTLVFRVAKGNDPYAVPLGPCGREAVAELLKLMDYKPPNATSRRRTLLGVGPGRFWQWASRAGDLAELHAWPHLFRHTFCTVVAHSPAGDPDVVRRLMNWKDLSQYPRYVAADDERMRAAAL